MKHHLKQLTGQSMVYGISGVATSIVGLVTLPIFARALDAREYGALELAVVVTSALMVVVDLGLASAAQRSYFDHSDDEERERAVILATALAVSLGSALLIAVVGIAGSAWFAPLVFGASGFTALWAVSLLLLPIGLLAQFTREVMRLRQRPRQYVASSIVAAAGGGALGVLLVLTLAEKALAIQIGVLIGAAASAVFGIVLVRRYLALRFSRAALAVMLAYGLPLVPSAAALWGLALADRLILARLGSLGDVGLYAIANRYAAVELLLVMAFALAYPPFVLALHKSDRDEELRVRARVMTYLTLTLFGGALLLSLIADRAIAIVAPAYSSASGAAIILTFAIAVQGVGTIALAGISIARNTRAILIGTMIAVACNLGLCFVLIPRYSYLGAALATFAAYALLTVLYFVAAARVETVRYEVRKLVTVIVVTGLAATIGLISFPSWQVELPAKLLAIVVVVALLIAAGVVGPQEREFLRESIRGRRRPRRVSD